MTKQATKAPQQPAQDQPRQPGIESQMQPRPQAERSEYRGSQQLLHMAEFGSDVPLQRAGQPAEVAPRYVFIASNDASYITGQVLHSNGGEIINNECAPQHKRAASGKITLSVPCLVSLMRLNRINAPGLAPSPQVKLVVAVVSQRRNLMWPSLVM